MYLFNIAPAGSTLAFASHGSSVHFVDGLDLSSDVSATLAVRISAPAGSLSPPARPQPAAALQVRGARERN